MPVTVLSLPSQKLVSILATSMPINGAYKEVYMPLAAENSLLFEYISCIYYPLCFKKDQAEVQALLDSNNGVNIMVLAYGASLDHKIGLTNLRLKKLMTPLFKYLL